MFAPLGVLMGLQYKWQVSLQKTSAIAEKVWLANYLETVANEVEYFYRKQAERALNIPGNMLARREPAEIVPHFKKKNVEGAKILFVSKFPSGEWRGLYAYNPASGKVGPPGDPNMLRAITVAIAPWKTLAQKGGELRTENLIVEENDPENRIILVPIIDDSGRTIGVAGMIVDTGYFMKSVLPRALKRSLPDYFDARARENLVIEVRDNTGRLVLGSEIEDGEATPVSRGFPFIFSDWRMALGSRYTTPEQWAEANFVLNLSLAVLLAVVLLGGIVLALRTASREMKLSQMKTDFVSNVSHELRTPLASIRVFGEFLRLGRVRDEDKIREYGLYIETESRRLTQLVNNILDFSKIESGAKSYDFQTADLQEVVTNTLRNLEVSLKHRGFRLIFQPPQDPMPPIRLDAEALGRAIANLVDNAVKYSDGPKEVEVRLQRRGDSAVIAVRDHGIGISSEEQQKIFDRFHRVSTGLIHDVKGSGLGLSIVSHIVKAHDGEIVVASEPGRGSTFSVRLPLKSRSRKDGTFFARAGGRSTRPKGRS